MKTLLTLIFAASASLGWLAAVSATIAKHYDIAAAYWGDATFHLIAFCAIRFWPNDGGTP